MPLPWPIPVMVVRSYVDEEGGQLLVKRGDNSGMLSFQKLDVYRAAIEFLALALEIIRLLPRGHADLADQLKRSAHSTPQNIAEGAGRMTKADKAKHFEIARGEAMESACTLDLLKLEELVDAGRYTRGMDLLERIVSMLSKMVI